MKRFTLSARVQFRAGDKPEEFQIVPTGDPWRFVTDGLALVLAPICDNSAKPVEKPPLFDRLEVRSVHWDYPDWVLSVHADELESLKRRYMAGELDQWFFESPPPAGKRKSQWPRLRATRFKAQLAQAHHPERRGLYFDDGSESGGWFNEGEIMLREANCEGHVANHELDRIAFRADFHYPTTGETVTIYLSGCARDALKPDEVTLQPGYDKRAQRRLREKLRLEKLRAKNLAANPVLTNQGTADTASKPPPDFTELKLPKSGKTIAPPLAAREILGALDAAGRVDVPCHKLKAEVAIIRGTKECPATLPQNYSPAKALKGSAAGRALHDERIVTYRRDPKQTLYSLHLTV